jgi:hypothetical protein
LAKEAQAFIDGTDGLVMLRNSRFEGFVLVSSLKGLLVE